MMCMEQGVEMRSKCTIPRQPRCHGGRARRNSDPAGCLPLSAGLPPSSRLVLIKTSCSTFIAACVAG